MEVKVEAGGLTDVAPDFHDFRGVVRGQME